MTPRFHPDVSKLESTIVDLKHKILTLETELQSAHRARRQQAFEHESVVMDIVQKSAELHHTIKKVDRLAKIGERLGLLPLGNQMRIKAQHESLERNLAATAAAQEQTAQALPAQDCARYERELAELREISEAMLKELERRIQGVEQAEEEASLWRQRAEALQVRLTASDQEYSKLEGRLTAGVALLRNQHEQEIVVLTEENVILRKKIVEGVSLCLFYDCVALA